MKKFYSSLLKAMTITPNKVLVLGAGGQTIVGAGSVVLKDASPNSLIYGAPAVKKE